jgi:hypothetical protein
MKLKICPHCLSAVMAVEKPTMKLVKIVKRYMLIRTSQYLCSACSKVFPEDLRKNTLLALEEYKVEHSDEYESTRNTWKLGWDKGINTINKEQPLSMRIFSYISFYRLVEYIGNIIPTIKNFIKRGIKGYSNSDLWKFDNYMNTVISNALREIANKTDCTVVMFSGDRLLEDSKESTLEKWKFILNYIADGFELDNNIDSIYFDDVVEYGTDLAELFRNGNKLKVNEARQLFIKHYSSLWY